MKKISLLFFLLWARACFAQITFQKTFTGNIPESEGKCVRQTSDGGYIIVGTGVRSLATNYDVMVFKTDSNGDTLWTKILGGNDYDDAFGVCETQDGGFAIVGAARLGAGMGLNVYLIKLNQFGTFVWSKTFDAGINDYGFSIATTNDGGLIIAGSTENQTSYVDVLMIKTDSNGTALFSKTFGSPNYEIANSAIQTSDSGFAILGQTSYGIIGSTDFYLLKTDINGNLLWSKTYGSIDGEEGFSLQQTFDGGFIMVGNTIQGLSEHIYIVKTDFNGNPIWSKTYGGSGSDAGYTIQQMRSDSGYIILGITNSFGNGGKDIYAITIDSIGNVLWSKTYGSIADEYLYSSSQLDQTFDGGFVFTGATLNFDSTSEAAYLVKTDLNGNRGCNETNPTTIVTNNNVFTSSFPTTDYSSTIITDGPPSVFTQGGIITQFCATSVIEKQNEILTLLSLSPNPTTGKLTISNAQSPIKQIDLFNLLGEKISLAVDYKLLTIDCSFLPPGIYILQASGEGKVWRGKIVKE